MWNHLVKSFLTGLLLLGAIGAAWVGGRAAWADALQLQVRFRVRQWQAGTALPSVVAWGEARNTLVHALTITPDDPQIHEDLGYLYGMRALDSKEIPELYQALLAQAKQYYVQASRLRPMSPHPWANIALAIHYKGALGAQLWDAFDRAMAYGQREPSVQMTLAEIGFAHWDELAQHRRSQLLSMLNQATPQAKGLLLAIAERHGHYALLQP